MSELLSKCCNKPLEVRGRTTKFWWCLGCNKPSEPAVEQMTPQEAAEAILKQEGEWGVGELGDAGLRDAIWDTYPAFQHMSTEDQVQFFDEVYEALFG